MTSGAIRDPKLSASVGDYLKAIWAIGGTGVVSTKEISVRLSVANCWAESWVCVMDPDSRRVAESVNKT